MPTLEIVMPSLHPGQRAVLESTARFKVLACGRRWGKTLLGVALCTATGLEGGRAWWIAPSYKVANVGWRGLKQLAQQIPGCSIREVDRQIIYPGGGWAQVRSADDPQSLRGEGLDLAVFDEFAFTKFVAWTEAVRPALSDRHGKALFISTPKGHNGFWQLYIRGLPGPTKDDEWESFQFPSAANPFLPANEIEEQRTTTPERIFEQEYMAAFIDDAGGVIRRVMEAATATEQERIPGHEYAFGVDWGKHNDFTVISVLDVQLRQMVAFDRFNQIDYQVQLGRLEALYEQYKPKTIIAESNSMGEPLIEQLIRKGMPVQAFQTTNATKAEAIDALALAFEKGDIRILPDPTLIAELQSYEAERLPSGLLRYGAPEGMHDDCVMSLALAWQACAKKRWLVG